MAVLNGIVRPQFFVALVAAVFCLSALPTRQYVGLQLVSFRQFIEPAEQRIGPVISSPHVLAAASLPQPPDCHKQACIALTFDDGPNPATTSKILDILEREHVPATFFVVGSRVAGNEALLRRMQAGGNEIGNHSWDHPDLTTLKPDQIRHEVADTQAALAAAGVRPPRLFRPPYGAIDKEVRQNVGLTLALWNEDPRDWDNKSAKEVQKAMLDSARPGGVIDAHDIYGTTAAAVGPTIKQLKARHFTFVTMSELMNNDDPGPGQAFYGYK
ncbi:MAG TPA: polysaccharide deacetylase family protein [Candidatus Saccharimonadales bacterium]|nr:polysaccharide deacetylase family protein [Candidatus Saccharimonadales bacterium]